MSFNDIADRLLDGFDVVTLGKRLMPPDIEFRESKQGAKENNLSWLHVRFAVKDAWYRRQTIERAHIRCHIKEEENNPFTGNAAFGMGRDPIDEIRDLRWQSLDNVQGTSNITLESGRPAFVPVVRRSEPKENEPPLCILTDQSYLMGQPEENWVKLPPGLYSIDFFIKAQNKEWKSPMYVLQVPSDECNNGQFILEKYYADEV